MDYKKAGCRRIRKYAEGGLVKRLEPEVSVESRGSGRPNFGAGLRLPLDDSRSVGVEGDYQKRSSFDPPEWSVRASFKKRF